MINLKKYNIFIDGLNLIYEREVFTYEKLCKVINKRKKVNIYSLNSNVYFKILNYIDKEKIYQFIEETFVGNEEYLIDYKFIGGKTYIYAIKGNNIINELLLRYENANIKPIEFKIKELLSKKNKNKTLKYKIRFMKKDFYIEIKDDILVFNKNIIDDEYVTGRLILNENREKIAINE